MKTIRLLLLMLLGISSLTVNAQISETTNAIVNTTSYVGTSNNKNVIFKRNAISSGIIAISTTSFGYNSASLAYSVSFGVNAGQFSSGLDGNNTYIGQDAGKGQSSSILNSGGYNTFVGAASGPVNTTGSYNTNIGTGTGMLNTTGSNNFFGGYNAGSSNTTGSNNVFLGANSGASYAASNRLSIDVVDTPNSLIWGDFSNDQLKFNGKVGIGGNTTTGFGPFPTTAGSVSVATYNLFVAGGILTEEIRVNARNTTTNQWADYVFNKDYQLKSLSEVENFINENGHLPNVPSATQVNENGIALGEMAKIQQEKIEELTLYIIELNKKLEAQEKKIDALIKNQK